MARIIVGVDASEPSRDAVAFARELHEGSGASVVLAYAWPVSAHVATGVREALESLAREFRGEVETRILDDASPARALHELAEEERAALLVVGSSHRSGLGQVLVGSTAVRLVHGAPCAVAVVPRGYHVIGLEPRFDRIGCAYDGSREASAALSVAAAAARSRHAGLRVIRAFDPADYAASELIYTPSYAEARDDIERRTREELGSVVADLPADLAAEALIERGPAAVVLAAESGRLDVLFVGSRGYGPLRAVLAGSVTRRLLDTSQCPVVVLPRGAEAHLEQMLVRESDEAAR